MPRILNMVGITWFFCLAALANSISVVQNQNESDRSPIRLTDLARKQQTSNSPRNNSTFGNSAEEERVVNPLQRVVDYLKQRNEENWLSISLMSLMPSDTCPDDDQYYSFHCPTPSYLHPKTGWKCVRVDELCNGLPDCPNAEDEDPLHCMFYKALKEQVRDLRNIMLDNYAKFILDDEK